MTSTPHRPAHPPGDHGAWGSFAEQVTSRLARVTDGDNGAAIESAIALIADSLDRGGVIQGFGTGHSQAFVMELVGRAGGLIPTTSIALRDIVLYGGREASVLSDGVLERDPSIVDELFDLSPIGPHDVFVIASNSGVNGSIVGMALAAKEHGHPLIAVTSLEHTGAVTPKHPSGKRLSEIADVVIDNLAPYGDTTVELSGADGPIGVGAVSSLTGAYIAQLLTIGVAERQLAAGGTPPIYLSANIPGGDEHNHALEDLYQGRIRRTA